MSCGRGTHVKPIPRGFDLHGRWCNTWGCAICAPHRKAQVAAEIMSGHPNAFLTTTWNASRPESPEEARVIIAWAWKRLVAQVRYWWPSVEFEYGVVVERTVRGYPHLHAALRSTYIPWTWLSERWEKLTGAFDVRIEAVRDEAGLARYLAKYLSKNPARIGSGKRYWFSQGYRPPPDQADQADRPVSRAVWFPDEIEQIVVQLTAELLIPLWDGPDHCLMLRLRGPPAPSSPCRTSPPEAPQRCLWEASV